MNERMAEEMRIGTCWLPVLLWVTFLFCGVCPIAPAKAGNTALSDRGAEKLAAIVADPMAQRADSAVVVAAISAIGDAGGIEGVRVLVENIAYPIVMSPLPAGAKYIRPPMMSGGAHIMGSGGLLIDAFPAAKALVRIGDVCIPQVLDKLAEAEDRTVRNACLDVLIELKERAQVKSMVEAKLDSARSSEQVSNLRLALSMLPGIDNQATAYPGWRSGLMNPDGVDGRAELMNRTKLKLVPMVVMGLRRSAGKTVEVDKVTLTSARELALLFGVQARQAGTKVTFFNAQTPQQSLVLEVGSKVADAGTIKVQLPAAPIRSGNAILVPLGAVAEHFGGSVQWNPSTRIARLVSGRGGDLK